MRSGRSTGMRSGRTGTPGSKADGMRFFGGHGVTALPFLPPQCAHYVTVNVFCYGTE